MIALRDSALLELDWQAAARLYTQRFVTAMERGDEEEAGEALTSALLSEKMADLQAMGS